MVDTLVTNADDKAAGLLRGKLAVATVVDVVVTDEGKGVTGLLKRSVVGISVLPDGMS